MSGSELAEVLKQCTRYSVAGYMKTRTCSHEFKALFLVFEWDSLWDVKEE